MTTASTSIPGALRLNESETERSWSSVSRLLLLLIIGLFIASRLWRLTSSCLWFDEIFGVHAARHDWGHLLQFVAADIIHPPLFYVLLKFWIGIGGDSILWLRLLPVVFSIAVIAPFLFLCRELRLTAWQTNLALALLAVNGYLIKYAQEVRMYSLLFFLTCVSLWLFVKFINARRNAGVVLLALTLVNLLLVYSHYYGWVVVIVELLVIVFWWREKLGKSVLATGALVVSYQPWLYFVTISKEPGRGLAQNIGWVGQPGFLDLAQFFSLLNIPFFFRQSSGGRLDIWSLTLSLLLFAAPFLILLTRTFRQPNIKVERRNLCWLLALVFLPIVIVFVLSWILPQSVWGSRHLIIVFAPYSILAAVAISKLPVNWMKTGCLVLLGCWVLLNGSLTAFRRPPSFTWCSWEPLAEQMMRSEANTSQPVQVYAFEDLVAYHLWFAFDNARRRGTAGDFKVHVVKGIPDLQEDPAYFLPRRFYEVETHDGLALKGKTIWLAFRDTSWNTARPPLSLIENQGFETGTVLESQAQGQKSFLVELKRKE